MKSLRVSELIASVGLTFESLVAQGVLDGQPLVELYPDCDLQDLEIENGVELTFLADTKKLKSLFITLIKTMPLTVRYEGDLPAPFKLAMTQADAHAIFGVPIESRGPIKMPMPMGQTGGWESYLLDQKIYPGLKVVLQYTADMKVKTLVFTLNDKGRE
ncbi:hypothetical protein JFT91_20745 [Pseudomonas sp. TH08]|uniref:DUF6392 family protein n=1 Tax=unclassified Pseudomonas TaxID=196821 RepID=UPI0019136C46|nr:MULTISPECIES: DUF6392 family protein [unclassified Pseudomonas]MBK5529882.1 hypothetical protein [Pseudomonas sp. TH06]MBK5534983.1 hypothetical protein [Pseudomonas sp. TH08]